MRGEEGVEGSTEGSGDYRTGDLFPGSKGGGVVQGVCYGDGDG